MESVGPYATDGAVTTKSGGPSMTTPVP